mgnify:FL=1
MNLYERAVEEQHIGWTKNENGTVKIINRPMRIDFNDDKFSICTVPHGYISDYLPYSRLNLNAQNPWFIDAQTGSGKTQFIFKILYPNIHKAGKRMLVLVSRSALKTKVKYDAIDAAKTDQRQTLQPYGIECEHHFGDIDVFSYQDITPDKSSEGHKHILERLFSLYGVVVFDECHYFTSDAVFNTTTAYTLEYLINLSYLHKVPRIYMTSTPDVVFSDILEVDREKFTKAYCGFNCLGYYHYKIPYYMNLFHCERDYSYITLSTFKDDDEHITLLQKISESNGKKWIIFVDSKEKGIRLQMRLKQTNTKTAFLCSENLHDLTQKKDDRLKEIISKLTDSETMDCDVLIATKCLDVGITIKDENINIVSYLHDKVDFLQSLGRKRVKKNETVNLLTPEYTLKDVNMWLSQTSNKYSSYLEAFKKYPAGESANVSSIEAPIYIKDGKYQHNYLAITQLNSQMRELTSLLERVKTAENNNENVTNVISAFFASWMDKCHTILITDATDEEKQAILGIIQKYMITSIDDTKFNELSAELKPFDKRKDKRTERQSICLRTINNIIAETGYKLENNSKKSDKKSYRIIPLKGEQ